MRKIGLKEHQQVILNIIAEFAGFCDKHNFNYFLDAGTLLGAVRHHGFIPWDNDADLCMIKPDFDKFIKLMDECNYKINDHLIIEKPENSIHSYYKICDTNTTLIEYPDGKTPFKYHIYIDLFVKVGLPNNPRKAKRICSKAERLGLMHWFLKRTINKWSQCKNLFKKIIGKSLFVLVRNKNIACLKQRKFIDNVNRKYPYEQCEYVTTLTNGEYYRRCKREYFDNYVYLDFCNRKFKCPAGYDGWLKVLYGNDYMEIPKKSEQTIHNIEVMVED